MKNSRITIIAAEDYYFGVPTINRICDKYQKNINSIILVKGFFSLKKIFYLFFMFNPFFIAKKIIQSFKHKKKLSLIINGKKINFFFTNNINSKKTENFLKQQNSNTLLILSCPQILSKKLLKIKKNNFNYHCSDLPKNRGLFPIFFTFINHNGSSLFCTLHYLNEKIDDGKILIQKKIKFKKLSLGKVYQRAFLEFEIIFQKLINKKFNIKINNKKLKTYNSYPKFKDFVKYYKILFF